MVQICAFSVTKTSREVRKFHQKVSKTNAKRKDRILQILEILNLREKTEQNRNAQSISYHPACFMELEYKYLKNRSAKKTKPLSHWSSRRNMHSAAFLKIQKDASESLIDNQEVKPLSDIYAMYEALFEEEQIRSNQDLSDTKFTAQHSLKKLMNSYRNLAKTVYKNRTYLHRDDLSAGEILAKGFRSTEDWTAQLKSIAFFVIQKVMSMVKRLLPKQNIQLEHVLEGECDTPKELTLLVQKSLHWPKWFQRFEKTEKSGSNMQ